MSHIKSLKPHVVVGSSELVRILLVLAISHLIGVHWGVCSLVVGEVVDFILCLFIVVV